MSSRKKRDLFGLKNFHIDDFIKVGEDYFQPVAIRDSRLDVYHFVSKQPAEKYGEYEHEYVITHTKYYNALQSKHTLESMVHCEEFSDLLWYVFFVSMKQIPEDRWRAEDISEYMLHVLSQSKSLVHFPPSPSRTLAKRKREGETDGDAERERRTDRDEGQIGKDPP